MTEALPWNVSVVSYNNFRPLRHVYPVNDLKDHALTIETRGGVFRSPCWCKPSIDTEDGSILVHNSMDRREEFEPDYTQRKSS